MMSALSAWVPTTNFEFWEVVCTGKLGEVCVGSIVSRLLHTLGTPPSPPARMKRGMLWYLYGNTSIFVENGEIVQIQADFEGAYPKLIKGPDESLLGQESWSRALDSFNVQASVRHRGDILSFKTTFAEIEVDKLGELHILTLR